MAKKSNRKVSKKSATTKNPNKKVLEGSITTNNLKELYEKLDGMTEAEIQTRINVIDTALSDMDYEFMSRQTWTRGSLNRRLRQNEIDSDNIENEDELEKRIKEKAQIQSEIDDNDDRVADIAEGAVRLQDEKKMLGSFGKVKERIGMIAEREASLTREKDEIVAAANARLEEAKAKAEEARKALDRQKEIEEEMKNLEEAKKLVIKTPKAIAVIDESIKDLTDEMDNLGKKEDLEADIKAVGTAQEELKKCTSRKNRIRCKDK